MKKEYTKEDKIKYYTRMMLNLEFELERVRDKLHYLNSPDYQDWSGSLQKQLAAKKNKITPRKKGA